MAKNNPRNIKGRKLPFHKLRTTIYTFLTQYTDTSFTARQMIKKMKIGNNKNEVVKVLDQLIKEDKVTRIDTKLYQLKGGRTDHKGNKQGGPRTMQTGKVDMTRSGAAYVVTAGDDPDVYVSAKRLNTAMDGDIVDVEIVSHRRGKPEGKIRNIIERSKTHYIGTYHSFEKGSFVVLDNDQLQNDIMIKPADAMHAQHRDKVVVKITDWQGSKIKIPVGIITEVLGAAGSHDIEMKSILINNGFDLSFSEAVDREMADVTGEITDAEIAKRRDFRSITTFTIDPTDAKDFDDALSIEYLDNGNYEIGVHIADVTHYVIPGTQLDSEAYERSTSVYLVDRVLPMLPEKLSNELCSLRPHEDSLTFSAVFTFDKDDKIVGRWFGKTIIHSDHRFTYDLAQEGIETKEGPFADELKHMNRVANILRKEKFKHGAIAFETDEVQFKLDEEGNPVDIWTKERKDAHLLVEDFMLLANKEVAKYVATKSEGQEIPMVYRIHDEPDPDRVAEFSKFAKQLGFEMQTNTPREIANSLNRLAKEAKKNELLKLLEPIAIRTMSKAVYSTENIGHYGLAFEYYTHFTSPIRRYSDVLVHRILFENLDTISRRDKEKLEAKCKHISTQERNAVKAERESIKYKQVQYLQEHIGEEFEGHVSGMIDSGFFIALSESKAEGLIGWQTLNEGFKVADSRLEAEGKQTSRKIKMGDLVRVRILETNLSRRQIEMELIEEDLRED